MGRDKNERTVSGSVRKADSPTLAGIGSRARFPLRGMPTGINTFVCTVNGLATLQPHRYDGRYIRAAWSSVRPEHYGIEFDLSAPTLAALAKTCGGVELLWNDKRFEAIPWAADTKSPAPSKHTPKKSAKPSPKPKKSAKPIPAGRKSKPSPKPRRK